MIQKKLMAERNLMPQPRPMYVPINNEMPNKLPPNFERIPININRNELNRDRMDLIPVNQKVQVVNPNMMRPVRYPIGSEEDLKMRQRIMEQQQRKEIP